MIQCGDTMDISGRGGRGLPPLEVHWMAITEGGAVQE